MKKERSSIVALVIWLLALAIAVFTLVGSMWLTRPNKSDRMDFNNPPSIVQFLMPTGTDQYLKSLSVEKIPPPAEPGGVKIVKVNEEGVPLTGIEQRPIDKRGNQICRLVVSGDEKVLYNSKDQLFARSKGNSPASFTCTFYDKDGSIISTHMIDGTAVSVYDSHGVEIEKYQLV